MLHWHFGLFLNRRLYKMPFFFHEKFVSHIFQWLFALQKLPHFACPVSLEKVCDASELVGYSRADLQRLCLSQKLVVAAELFVSVGLRSFVDVPELFIFSKKDAAVPQMRLHCGSCSEPKAVTNPAVWALALAFPQIGSWPQLSRSEVQAAVSAVVTTCALSKQIRNALWPRGSAFLTVPHPAFLSNGGGLVAVILRTTSGPWNTG